MGKVVIGILVVAAVVALVVFAPQILVALGPAFATTAVTAAGATVITVTTLGTIVATLAIAAVSMVAQMLLAPKPPALNQATADRLNSSISPVTPRKIVFGHTAAGSDVRFEEKQQIGDNIDKGNEPPDYLYQVMALASHKINAVKQVYFEDVLTWQGSPTGKYASGISITPVLEGSASNAAAFGYTNKWSASSKFTGCAYLKIKYKLDYQKLFPDGLPTRITNVVEGCPVFDPRLSTAVGGSGTMSPTDQTTWKYYNSTDEIGRNPACCLLTYILGWRINGKLAWGMGIPPERIDFANFITYANVCDEPVTTKGGGTIKRYQCDTIMDTSMTHEACINNICASMGVAKMTDTNGLYQLVGGYDDTDGPILTFTADDFMGSYEWSPAVPLRERFNIATGRYASPEDLYVLKDWGTIELDPLADGIPRAQQMDFASVSRSATCQRIAKQRLLRNQKTGKLTCTLGPRAFSAKIGSLCYVSLPGEGWNNKLFRVVDQAEAVDLIFQMALQEEDPAIYAWDSSEEQDLPANIKVGSYDPTEVVTVQDLLTDVRQITNSTGGLESFIDVTWQVPPTLVTSIQIQTKEATGTIWSDAASAFDAQAGEFTFKAPAGGLSTDIRARYRMHSGALGPWSTANVLAADGGGANPFVGVLTNESVTFPADKDGNIL